MTSQNDDDDWDKVEIKLETMKLNEPKSILKPPVSIAPRYNPGNSGNTDLQSSYGSSSPVIIRPGVQCVAENVPEGALDSALISAMTSSRERMVCLQIENSILNFVKSNDKSMDIPTQFNSFRRLLVYRVGQRFGLNHVQTDSVNEYGERGVTLYKTANTFIPKKLLIDLNIPVNQDDDFDGNTGGSGSGSNQTEPAPAPQKKFMVMKRNPARSDDGAKVVAVKVQQSAEDKERAYQQARARIFGEENAGGASTPGSQVDSTPVSGNVSPALPDSNGNSSKGNKTVGGNIGGSNGGNSPVNSARNSNSSSPQPLNSNNNNSNGNNNNNSSSAGIAATNSAAVKRNTSDSALSVQSNGSANGGSGGNNSNKKKETTNISPAGKTSTTSTSSSPVPGDSAEKAKIDSNVHTTSATSASSVGTNAPKKAVVNANNWKENKSQVRNLEAERSDPDFARRNNHNSNNNNGYNGGRGHPSADSVGMSSAAATGVLQYTNNTFYPAAPQQPMYYPPMDANQMNHLVAAQQQFLYQQQQHLQLQQQQQQQNQQQGMYGGFPPLNFNSAVPPQGAGLQGPGGMQLAPTLPDNPYHPMSTAAGASPQQQWQPQYNPYYPMPHPPMQQQQPGGGAPLYQQQQQQFVPPPPPFAPPVQQQQASPSATFFDYSHLSTKNQQAQQRNKNSNNNNNGNGPSPADYPPLA